MKKSLVIKTFAVLLLLAVSVGLLGLSITVSFQSKESVSAVAAYSENLDVAEKKLDALQREYEENEKKLSELSKKALEVDKAKELSEIKAAFFNTAAELEKQIYDGKNETKIAYLTFDDGPYDATPEFLNILKNKDVLATFFVLGKPARVSQYKDAANAGHSVQNHTYSHKIKDGLYESPESFINDVKKLEVFLAENAGIKTDIVRFPGGMAQSKELKPKITALLAENGYGWVDWSAAAMDGSSKPVTAEEAYENTIAQVKKQKTPVILIHDYSTSSLHALPRIIETLKEKGYIFLPLFKESAMIKKTP